MAARIQLPNGWEPRKYQLGAWNYLEAGGKHAEIVAHRRWGKDDLALHRTAIAAHERAANYWHMLPLANQARKAIWTAVNPHTGKRRIDEAFPQELRKTTRDQEMMIEFKCGSTWQVLGSDNYQGSIGASPAGIVYSEWAQSDPSAPGYLRPILAENNGWALYITTPRGHNHAERTFREAQRNPDAYAELSPATATGVFSEAQLAAERTAYIAEYGEDFGISLFEQEYLCSFNAAVIGAYYGSEMAKMEREGRICEVAHDPAYPVHTAWDLGYTDDGVIWFYQVIAGEVLVIDYHADHSKGLDHYLSQLLGRKVTLELHSDRVVATVGEAIPEIAYRAAYDYGTHNLPHDARAKSMTNMGKSAEEQLAAGLGWAKLNVLGALSVEDGIQAARTLMARVVMDADKCHDGIEALKSYQRKWDDTRKVFLKQPLHNWASHPADGFRMLAMGYQLERKPERDTPPPPPFSDRWFDERERMNPHVDRQRAYR